jgi:hypothetical protein
MSDVSKTVKEKTLGRGEAGSGELGRDLRQETPDIGCQGTAGGREEPEIGGASEGPDR